MAWISGVAMAYCAPRIRFHQIRDGGEPMADSERRRNGSTTASSLRAQLNEDQRMTLSELERFGWELKFIRRKPFQDPIPVVFDGDRKSFAVIRIDGTLDDKPEFDIRGA